MEHVLQIFVCDLFKKHIDDNGITQNLLSQKLNTSRQVVSNYLTGRTDFSLNMFERFCNALNIKMSFVIAEFYKKQGVSIVSEPEVKYQAKKIESVDPKDLLIRSLMDQVELSKRYISTLENQLQLNKQTGS
ncbi:MAG: hypothetical protein A2W90_02435 [Bacteroidetes bacterium GWF2_42_66]|nr:MAG: hypothetical protein A2W92_08510 [Bacteroidetes bacterium GWA2_42_15]OFY01208.1 MAG: hypothetical protein A2W89_15920 [Bacteroidetes bacterium GWE2_42_39]OFY42051.1 MAG: hypothetical protein A2W90_02435 [Bacteroidetes bacterium GWF2_42_66]HBL77746.1 hypothetical protein [Prolixibacteraceae bacterium]HCB62875.1 hypothetical protein [Bacteroidales bacterium]